MRNLLCLCVLFVAGCNAARADVPDYKPAIVHAIVVNGDATPIAPAPDTGAITVEVTPEQSTVTVPVEVTVCDCATTGVCICEPDECQCANCPEHQERLWLVVFGADWCGPCNQLERDMRSNATLRDAMQQCSYWHFDDPPLETRLAWKVTTYPTVFLLSEKGGKSRQLWSQVGYDGRPLQLASTLMATFAGRGRK